MNRNGPIDQIEHQMAVLIRRAEATRKADPTVGRLDRSAYLLLGWLEQHQPVGPSALAAAFQLDLSTVSRQVASLLAKGQVERLADPKDGRVTLLQLTAAGRERLRDVREARRALYQDLLADWPLADQENFARLLTRFNEAATRRRMRK